jgi:carbamate kinase
MAAGDRVVVALGGNAITPPAGRGTPAEQIEMVGRVMRLVAGLVADGLDVVVTHGNGPQVGNLLIKNEAARDLVPPVPLDWCVAQTQATIGFMIATALEEALAAVGVDRPVAPTVSRVLVDAGDPAFDEPTKPIGMFVADEATVEARRAEGQVWRHIDERGWRRVVPSPEPRELLDVRVVHALLDAGAVVVAAGGGGIPMVRDADGRVHGVEAVIDKDLAGSLLAQAVGASRFAVITDVAGVAVGFGTPGERWLGETTTRELRALQAAGEFAAGSIGPKVEAVCRFVEATGGTGAIGALEETVATVRGEHGTQVRPS